MLVRFYYASLTTRRSPSASRRRDVVEDHDRSQIGRTGPGGTAGEQVDEVLCLVALRPRGHDGNVHAHVESSILLRSSRSPMPPCTYV